MKLSLCITNYNRTTLLEESFKEVLDDERISEIIISDDNSNMPTCRFLYMLAKTHPKISLIFHRENVGMYENKKRAISYAANEWCILFDSDNVITPSYISAFYEDVNKSHGEHHLWHNNIYCPDFAFPQFDYRKYADQFYGLKEVQRWLAEPMFECLLNTCNYIVNRSEYLRIWKPYDVSGAADSIYFMYLWLKAGNSFLPVPGMLYNHRVHPGSGFMQDVNGNMAKAAYTKKLILNL